MVDPDYSNPYLTELVVSNISRTDVDLTFGTSEISIVFYVIALQNTEAPSYEDASSQKFYPNPSTRARIGSLLIDSSSRIKIKISDLEANVQYSVYAYV